MINSKKELQFYLMADRMMNRGAFKITLIQRLKRLIVPDLIKKYLYHMRKTSYYMSRNSYVSRLVGLYHMGRYTRLGLRLGFSIGYDVFGYGLVIPHHGTIVVGASNRIGNYAVLHTSTCISDNNKVVGNALYLSTGAKMTSTLILGDNVSVAANSVVNKSYKDGCCLIAGTPALFKKAEVAWYNRDGVYYTNMVNKCEFLKKEMGL